MKTKNKGILASLALATGLGLKYNHDQCFVAREKTETFYSDKVNSDIKITHISDFHSNVLSNLDEVLGNIKKFDPDLIFLTGDMIDYPTDSKIERTMYFINKLDELGIKTYFVSGNHEEASQDSEKFYAQIQDLGIRFLQNEGEKIKIRDNDLYIYGTSYFGANLAAFDPSENSLNLVLSHFSKKIRDKYDPRIDFIFSGHTHGGQVRAPFIGALVAPGEGYFPKYDRGEFKYGSSTIYIESGLGNTFLPLRFLNPISYTNITIKRP